jgi:uncharacterized membrane protein
MLNAFAAWLLRTPVTAFLENAAWAVPTIQTLHILCIAIVFGGAVFINLRVFGLIERDQPVEAVLGRFLPPMSIAIVVLAVTGALLIASEPNRALFRVVFWVKMALVLLALAATWTQRRLILTGSARDGGAATFSVRLVAGVTLLLWIGVIFAGRWIGYATGWPGSPS